MTPNIQPNPGIPYQPPVQRRGWWSRNWLWFVPTGCLTLLALVAVFVMGLLSLVYGVMKSSDVYKMAARRAETDNRVVEALGSPVTEGMFMGGNINVTNDSGQADISIPLSGSKGKGTMYVVATKSEGTWTFSTLHVKVNGTGQTIDLLEPAAP